MTYSLYLIRPILKPINRGIGGMRAALAGAPPKKGTGAFADAFFDIVID
jgi:hypothetical protein